MSLQVTAVLVVVGGVARPGKQPLLALGWLIGIAAAADSLRIGRGMRLSSAVSSYSSANQLDPQVGPGVISPGHGQF